MLTLKCCQATCVFLGQPGCLYVYTYEYMCVYFLKISIVSFWGYCRKIFILSPVGFVISPVGNLLLGLTLKIFLKFKIFDGESSSLYRGTETGCLRWPIIASEAFIAEKLEISTIFQLVESYTKFKQKDRYFLHYRYLQLYLRLGMKLTKIHRLLTFKQPQWLKPCIDFF